MMVGSSMWRMGVVNGGGHIVAKERLTNARQERWFQVAKSKRKEGGCNHKARGEEQLNLEDEGHA